MTLTPSRSIAPALLLALSVGACTTFYGLAPDATSTSTSSGTGGAGGSPARGLLPKLDAAHLCSLVASCPALGRSIVASTGLPVVEVDAGAESRNYSACVDWLTLPIGGVAGASTPPARVGFDPVRSMIVCMAASTSCDDASRCALREVLTPGDARCSPPTTSCDAQGNLLDCANGELLHCKTDLFAPDSVCTEEQGVIACAAGLCAGPEVNCDNGYVFTCGAAMEPKASFDCTVFGLVCDATSADATLRGCFGATGKSTCSAASLGSQTCFGSRQRTCSGIVQAEVDCAALGETCVADAGTPGPARCKRSDAACSPYDATSNVCSGSAISLCLDGQTSTVDCAAIGLSCVPGSGATTSHCG